MVTDQQVRRLLKLMNTEKTLGNAAAKAGMDEKTARKYGKSGMLPSEIKTEHDWRTRPDLFEEVWSEVESELQINSGLRAKTLFVEMQRRYPGRFADGQLRTLQRRVKQWRATQGPPKELFFVQKHQPGKLCQSDFTSMNSLGVTICRLPFEHLLYHFTLTYSNWEQGTVCFSESFESLSEGLQNALWKLGAVAVEHQTDRLSAAVNNLSDRKEFTARYEGLLRHYGTAGRKTNPASPNENGDVEQRNYRFKDAVDQALMLRGSRDFSSREEYEDFLNGIFDQLNAGRKKRLIEELLVMRRLPERRLESCKRLSGVRVGRGGTINVMGNVYSLDSRLKGEQVDVRVHAEYLEVWYGQRKVDKFPRLLGKGKHRINYRHVIDSLVRKPGAFENYSYREELFPTSRFRVVYDLLRINHAPSTAAGQYLKILHLAATESEEKTDSILKKLIEQESEITFLAVQRLVKSANEPEQLADVKIEPVSLLPYDELLETSAAR